MEPAHLLHVAPMHAVSNPVRSDTTPSSRAVGRADIGGYDTNTRRFSMRVMQKKGAVRPYPPLSVFICVGFLWEDVFNSTELFTLCQLQASFNYAACAIVILGAGFTAASGQRYTTISMCAVFAPRENRTQLKKNNCSARRLDATLVYALFFCKPGAAVLRPNLAHSLLDR